MEVIFFFAAVLVGAFARFIIERQLEKIKQRYLNKLKQEHLNQFKWKMAPVFFLEEEEQLAFVCLEGCAATGIGRFAIPVRSTDPNTPVHLTTLQIKQFDGLYKCFCNATLSKEEITIEIHRILLGLNEEAVQNFKRYFL
ncbi:MAG: hypothetical protein ACRBFS_07980 [Aureispira sp.]